MDFNEILGPVAIFGLFLVVGLFWMLFAFVPVRLWIEAWAADVKITLGTLIGMRLRKVAPAGVGRPLTDATHAGLHPDPFPAAKK